MIRGPPPFRSWSVGNQSGGMCSDSESAGGSSESRSMDSPSASPGTATVTAIIIFKSLLGLFKINEEAIVNLANVGQSL